MLKKMMRTAVAIMLAGTLSAAWAADYPTAPVTLVVPTGAGGGTDLAARAISEKLAAELGQPVIIENKAGAGGIIGNQAVARAKPDGYTLLISSNQFGIIPAVQRSLPYDPLKDFIPITSIGVIPTLVLLNPKLPINSIDELIAQAKKEPGQMQYASAGIGSPNHLFAAMFAKMADLNMLHVPYRGTAPALMGVAGDEVSLAFASLPASKGLIASKKLKPIAITSAKRMESLPDLPAISETVPDYAADIWLGVWGVAGTPADIIDKVHAALVATLKDPGVIKSLSDQGLVIQTRSKEEFAQLVKDELVMWNKVVDESDGEIQRQ